MINTDRVVPIQAVDLISMYGLILLQNSNNSGLTALAANDVEGDFTITSGTAALLANEPVKSINIASGVSAATIFFVAGYNYEGITVNNVAATIADNDVEVNPDGKTLYKAVLSSGTVTITQVGF